MDEHRETAEPADEPDCRPVAERPDIGPPVGDIEQPDQAPQPERDDREEGREYVEMEEEDRRDGKNSIVSGRPLGARGDEEIEEHGHERDGQPEAAVAQVVRQRRGEPLVPKHVRVAVEEATVAVGRRQSTEQEVVAGERGRNCGEHGGQQFTDRTEPDERIGNAAVPHREDQWADRVQSADGQQRRHQDRTVASEAGDGLDDQVQRHRQRDTIERPHHDNWVSAGGGAYRRHEEVVRPVEGDWTLGNVRTHRRNAGFGDAFDDSEVETIVKPHG